MSVQKFIFFLHKLAELRPAVSGRMFGSQFWNYSIICGTQWGYDSRRIEMRNSSNYDEESWTSQINKLLTGLQGSPTDLPSVFIDSFYDVGPSELASRKFRENTERLLQVRKDGLKLKIFHNLPKKYFYLCFISSTM